MVVPHLTQCLDFSVYETLRLSLPILVIFTMRLPMARYPRLLINLSTSSALDLGKRETLCLTGVCAKLQASNCLRAGSQQWGPLNVLINAVQTRVSSSQ